MDRNEKDSQSSASNPDKTHLQGKSGRTERQKRLGTALRENLRKRKNQTQERQKSKALLESDLIT
jgi:hypothetical protein